MSWVLSVAATFLFVSCGADNNGSSDTESITTLSPREINVYRDQATGDEQLLVALLETERELVQSFTNGDDEDYRKFFQFQVDSAFPRYRGLVGSQRLEACLNRTLQATDDLRDLIISMQLIPESFQPSPNWTIPSVVPGISGINLLIFGRPYSFEAEIIDLNGKKGTGVFHAIMINNTAYIIPNFDLCLDRL